MRITIRIRALNDALKKIFPSVGVRCLMPLYGCICMKTERNKLILSGTDTEIVARLSVDCQIHESGSIALPAKTFAGFCEKLPETEVLEMSTSSDFSAAISCGLISLKLVGMNPADFPSLWPCNGTCTATVKVEEFVDLIDSVIQSIAPDYAINQNLAGLHLEFSKDEVTGVGIDGFRISCKTIPCSSSSNSNCTVLGKKMKIIFRMLKGMKPDKPLRISFDSKTIWFKCGCGDWEASLKLLQGKYIDYKKLLSREVDCTACISVETEALKGALKRAMLFAKSEENSLVKASISSENLIFKSASERGASKEVLAANCKVAQNFKEIDIGFNGIYFDQCLASINDDRVDILVKDGISPIFLKVKDQIDMILPVRLS